LIEGDGVRFLEVYVRCPLQVLIDRDVKGLYKRALAGEVRHFTGISDPYEAPLAPDCIVDSSAQSIEQSLSEIFSQVEAIVSVPAVAALEQGEAVL
jgi:adenylylsulfate kinase-like enzyme